MMKIKLKSRNFEELQRFSASSTKSEKIRANLIEKAKVATTCKVLQFYLAFLTLKAQNKRTKFAEILRSERCQSMYIL